MTWPQQLLDDERAEKKKKRRTLTINLNDQDMLLIQSYLRICNTADEGTAIKRLAKVGFNVLHGAFLDEFYVDAFIKRHRKSKYDKQK